jgi:3'-phosphoadenosine 5'-phosphosulfate sulfotransferase (PAPS reductase)/FAD synthetase
VIGRTSIPNAQFQSWFESPSIPLEALMERLNATRMEIASVIVGKRCAVAWSGGKEGQALIEVLRPFPIRSGVLALTQIEYPSFATWCATHKPPYVETVVTHHDLAWLRDHPRALFPACEPDISAWARRKQIPVQERYCRQNGIEVLLTGRRTLDGNQIARSQPFGAHEKAGVLIYSPLRDWSHEETLNLLHVAEIPLPPIYFWENGWRHGSKHWALLRQRQCGCDEWDYIYRHEPCVVEEAAPILPSARTFLESRC